MTITDIFHLVDSYTWTMLAEQSNYRPALHDLFLVETALSEQEKQQARTTGRKIIADNYELIQTLIDETNERLTLKDMCRLKRRSEL